MKRIFLLVLLAIVSSSCANKAVVAAFAPSVNFSEQIVTEAEKPREIHEALPSKLVNQDVQQNEASMLAVAAPVAPKAQQKIAALHLDRILDAAPVRSHIQKASFKKLSPAPRGARNWAPQLKIGLTLLAIGVVLAVFGLGFVGGLSALIGLLFTIVGLLVTY